MGVIDPPARPLPPGGEQNLLLKAATEELQDKGFIVETRDRPAPEDDDERRRYYRITPLGVATAREETRRLAQLVRMARAKGLAPGKA